MYRQREFVTEREDNSKLRYFKQIV